MVKLGSATVGSLIVMLLSAIGYVPNRVQSAATQTGIIAIVNLFPTVIITGVLLVTFGYKLTDNKMPVIMNELVKKRNGQAYDVIEF